MRSITIWVYGVAAIFGLFSSPVIAAQDDSDWDYFLGGYLHMLSVDGKSTSFTPAGDQEMAIDLSFSDLLDNLDYGASGVFFARKGPLSINVDLVAAGVSASQWMALPPPGAGIAVDIEVDVREYELFAGYAMFEQYPHLEVIAGARYVDQDIKVDISLPGPLTPPQIDIGDDWVDPFIGLRYMGPISENWNWNLRGDIGGFGVGSDTAWRVDVGASYRFGQKKKWEAAIFYKVLDMDYESGTSGTPSIYKWDGSESGISLGVGYHF